MKFHGSDCIGRTRTQRRRCAFMLLLSTSVLATSGLLYLLLSASQFNVPPFLAELFKPTSPISTANNGYDAGIIDEAADSNTLELHPQDHVFREPTTIYLAWNVTKQERAPDGAVKSVYLINGEQGAGSPLPILTIISILTVHQTSFLGRLSKHAPAMSWSSVSSTR
jgi:hypothetical protein